MNIFALDHDPRLAAEAHCDKHVVKMTCEVAQLLSTAHRALDGMTVIESLPSGKIQRFVGLPGEVYTLQTRQSIDGRVIMKYRAEHPLCYNATHANHPSAVWARLNTENYQWLYQLFEALSAEYTYRYGKIHKTWQDNGDFLRQPPANLKVGVLTAFPQTMPEEFKDKDPVRAYKNFYLGPKAAFAKWTRRPAPSWFTSKELHNAI